MKRFKLYSAAFQPLSEEPRHLGGVGHVVVDKLAPDRRHGHQVGVGDVRVCVYVDRYLARTR